MTRRARALVEVDPGISGLPAEERARAAAKWADRAAAELQAAGGFAMVCDAAFQLGAEPEVLALCARGSADELRHSALCGELAERYRGAAAPPPRLVPFERPHYPGAGAELTLHLHLVSIACFNETIATAYFEACLADATQPLAREALRTLLGDEIDHARLGWAHLASRRVDVATRRAVGRWVVPLLDAHRRAWRVRSPQPAPRQGCPTADVVHAAVDDALRTLVVPGLRHVGVPTRDAEAWLSGL